MKTRIIYFSICIMLLISFLGQAQEKTTLLTKAEKDQAVEKICQLLNRFYVFPEVATKMEKHIKAKSGQGVFEKIADPNEFAATMTEELRSICHDKHLRMFIGPNPDEQTAQERNLQRIMNRLDNKKYNYGLTRVEILDGNVGYMNIQSVMYSGEAMEVVSAALKFLSNTDALIFDLRQNNQGGDPG